MVTLAASQGVDPSYAQTKNWTSSSTETSTGTDSLSSPYLESELWFNSLTEVERRELQSALILTGDYTQIVDGVFGNGTVKALKSFQARNGDTATGVLSPSQLQVLRQHSAEEAEILGFKPFYDERAGFTISVPLKYLDPPRPIQGGNEWKASDGRFFMQTIRYRKTDGSFAATYKDAISGKVIAGLKYRTFRPGFFIVSGLEGNARFYMRLHDDGDGAVGFLAFWPNGQDADLRRLVVAISNSIKLKDAENATSLVPDNEMDSAPLEKIEQRPLPDGPKKAMQTGTGFFVAEAGYLLTNAHVVEGCKDAKIRLSDGRFSQTSIISRDASLDLAILKSQVAAPKVATFRISPPLRLGTDVIVFGYPRLDFLTSTGNLASGLVSALAGPNDDASIIQISAPVQSGNSGGAVLDRSGNVVGVVVAKTNADIASERGEIFQQVNFAISGDVARSHLTSEKTPFSAAASLKTLDTADIADLAKQFTVIVVCQPE